MRPQTPPPQQQPSHQPSAATDVEATSDNTAEGGPTGSRQTHLHHILKVQTVLEYPLPRLEPPDTSNKAQSDARQLPAKYGSDASHPETQSSSMSMERAGIHHGVASSPELEDQNFGMRQAMVNHSYRKMSLENAKLRMKQALRAHARQHQEELEMSEARDGQRKRRLPREHGGRFQAAVIRIASEDNDDDETRPTKRIEVEVMVKAPATIIKSRPQSEDPHAGSRPGPSARTAAAIRSDENADYHVKTSDDVTRTIEWEEFAGGVIRTPRPNLNPACRRGERATE